MLSSLRPSSSGNDLAARQDGDILEHGLAAIAEAGGFYGADIEGAAEVVDDKGGESLAFDVLCDDEKGLSSLGDLLEYGKKVFHVGNFLVMDENEGVFEDCGHGVAVGHEIRRGVAAVELHAFDKIDRRVHGFGLFDRDDAVFSDLFHRIGDLVADIGVVVGGYGGYVRDFLFFLDFLGAFLDFFNRNRNGHIDAALETHRIHAGGHGLEAFLDY